MISLRSPDRGRTWESPVDVEPAVGPEASYAVLLTVPSGRIYCFYNHNSDNVREVKREDGGKFYITETQKNVSRVHEIPQRLLDGLFKQWDCRTVATEGLVLNMPGSPPLPREVPMPKLPDFHQRDARAPDHRGKDLRAGFTLDLWLQFDALTPGQVVLDSRDATGKGAALTTTDTGTLKLTLNDGRSESSWDTDRGVVQVGQRQHVVVTVDGGPKIITFVVDGVLCDGGDQRQFGWGRFSPTLRTPNSATLRIAPQMNGSVLALRIYNRYLRTSEAVANFQAGL